jgi:hypothetical protein
MQVQAPKYNGDPTIASLANGLGTLGRYGDSYMVHAAEGETVVPAEILAANPQLRDQLFWQMRMMGIADPNRYVVGNSLNSLNPITGQPEFFFKKIFKAVKKVFKKALPIIAPIVGNLILPGIGGPIASALVTKLQGGSWGDVLKSAALSYGASALGAGISGGIGGLGESGGGFGSGFAQGLGEGIMAPFQAAGNLFAGTGLPFLGGSAPASLNPLAQGIFGPSGWKVAFPGSGATTTGMGIPASLGGGTLGAKTLGYSGGLFPSYTPGVDVSSLPQSRQNLPQSQQNLVQSQVQGPYAQGFGSPQYATQGAQTPNTLAWGQDHSNILQPGGGGAGTGAQIQGQQVSTGIGPNDARRGFAAGTNLNKAIETGQLPAEQYFTDVQDVVRADGTTVRMGTLNGKRVVIPDPPGLLKRVIQGDKAAMGQLAGKTAETFALPLTLAAASYFMTDDVDEVPEGQLSGLTNDQRKAYDQYLNRGSVKDETGLSLLIEAGISPTQNAAELSSKWGITEQDAQTFLSSFYGPQNIAKGGIVGLQGGGEIAGPGTGTSDSIPARLSDGEFVMTADAVRGMGNGSRDLGAARMYDLMSRFERTA